MKNLLLPTLGLLFLLLTAPAHGQWRTIYHGSDPDNDIKGASFYTPREGWIATSKYTGFTQDSGQSFEQRPVTLNNVDYNSRPVNLTFGFTPTGVKAFSRDVLLLYGDYGFEPSILYSADGGLHWKLVYHQGFDPGTYLDLQTVHKVVFPQNTKVGYAVQGNAVLKTTDGGLTWQATTFSGYQLSGLDMVSDSTGYLVGKDRLYYTGNGGRWWDAVGSAPKGIELIDFISATTGYAFTWEGLIYVTTDRGATWTLTNTAETAFLPVDVHFTDERTGYAAGGLYTLFKTENSGRTWEELEGSRSFEYLGYSFESLHFYNNSLAWASGRRDFLMKTDNAGGRTYPRAQFSVDRSLYCAQNLIQLQSRSLQTNAHRWYRNGALFSTDYATSYTPGLTPDTIMLVVENALGRDTATQTVQETLTTNFSFVSLPRDTFHCAGQSLYFDIPASNPKLTYEVCLGGGGCMTSQRGNGGLLTLSIGTNTGWSQRQEYLVKATRVNDCGTTVVTNRHYVQMANSQVSIAATADPFCAQKETTYLKVANSRTHFTYWADTTFPKVAGNGGEILLPVRTLIGKPQYGSWDPLNETYSFPVSATYDLLACPTSNPKVVVPATARYSDADFDVPSLEYFTGDTATLVNRSLQASSYTWSFDEGAAGTPPTAATPTGLYWTTPGRKFLQLDAYTPEGCRSTATGFVEVFQNTAPSQSQAFCRRDSLPTEGYLRHRSTYEDEYGNYYLTGGRKAPEDYRIHPAGGEGWFLYKFNKDHGLEWKLEQKSTYIYPYNLGHHMIFENVVADRYGYIYLLGHAYDNPYVSAGEERYPLHGATTVFMKVSPTGKIVWVKELYNDPKYLNRARFTGGTLLRGKNDDLYIVTQHFSGGTGYLMDDRELYNYSSQPGVILHLDRNGSLLDSKLYPSVYNNLSLYSGGENYDPFPKAVFDSLGRIAVYTELDPYQISGGRIDDAVLAFDPAIVTSALLYYDTAARKITDARPVYRLDSSGRAVGVKARSVALDAAGNYYAAWLESDPIPKTTQYNLSHKTRGVVAAYSAAGKQLWSRRAEGLEPQSLQAAGGKVYVLGQNHPGYAFTTDGTRYYSAHTDIDTGVRKLTAFYDSTYRSTGLPGKGATDIVLARLDGASGAVEAITLEGTKQEEQTFVVQKGYGDQLIATAQSGFNLMTRKQAAGLLHLWRLPVGTACTTTYQQPSPFLLFDHPGQRLQCTDSLVKLRWSSLGVQKVQLLYSKDSGATYQVLADEVAAAGGEYVFHLDKVPLGGYARFKIIDKEHPSLNDTMLRTTGRNPYGLVLTADPPERSCLSDKVTLTSGATCSDCSVLWNTGDTTPSITVSRSKVYLVAYQNSCGKVEGYKDVTIVRMPEINLSVSSTAVCEGTPVRFKVTTSVWELSWTGPNLTRGNGDTILALPPPGTTVYKLKAGTVYGCVREIEIPITVGPTPPPTVSISTQGCGSGTLLFTANVRNGGLRPDYYWTVDGAAAGTDSTLSRPSLPAGSQVSCRVTAKDVCATNNSTTATVTVNCTTTGLPVIDGLETYSVSPNPSPGRFVVKMYLKAPRAVTYTVRDARGREVYRSAPVKRSGQLEKDLDLSALAAGIYYLSVQVGSEQFTDKLLKR